ncbi:MAG: hypothetical protein UT24_C0009G0113 [Candidatus Woesebacteria bacterium GW2011_GWB1_39_12]|uniref:Uncharacterized protein n=2 Tax=Candidatus Woeseibacteriota TaxID=1752722 RepID=A0A0G0QAA8_9BACT|nr:MAG: hypothetical protein UT23_C0002G0111 [Candidatus Woesebacteria bacterium GW2011_GWA1_39_12]KKR00796.1 MAG: hypothetical protein UT24_C0009G0113 [Candidatus Woesebacteria bacterium GW2011_GWB1_39_12]
MNMSERIDLLTGEKAGVRVGLAEKLARILYTNHFSVEVWLENENLAAARKDLTDDEINLALKMRDEKIDNYFRENSIDHMPPYD